MLMRTSLTRHAVTHLCAIAIVTSASTASFAADVVTLKMANWVPPQHHLYQSYVRIADRVAELTNGTLKIEIDKTALAKPGGQYELVKSGVRDMAWDPAAYNPGLFELLRAMEGPFTSADAESGSVALHKWYFKHGFDKREWGDKGAVILNAYVHGPGHLFTTKQKVAKLEDLQGLKIRAAGGAEVAARALGATPVSIPASGTHEAMLRGTVDGTLFSWDTVVGFKLAGLFKHALEIPGGLYTVSFWTIINQAKFDSLSPEHRKALIEAAGVEGARTIGRGWREAEVLGKDAALKSGTEVTEIDPKERERWAQKVRATTDEWIKQADAKGLDGKALFEDLLNMAREEAAARK